MNKDTKIYYEGKKLEIENLLKIEMEKEKTAKKNISFFKKELKKLQKNAI